MKKAQSKLVSAISTIPDLAILGTPSCLGAAFYNPRKTFNIFSLESFFEKKGWNINCVQNPAAVSLILTPANAKNIDEFIKILK